MPEQFVEKLPCNDPLPNSHAISNKCFVILLVRPDYKRWCCIPSIGNNEFMNGGDACVDCTVTLLKCEVHWVYTPHLIT